MLIGIHGLATSGKTTIAKMLVERYAFHRVAFADPLKSMLNAIGIDREHTHGDKKEEPLDILCGKSARFAMTRLGTEFGRNLIGEDFWVNVWEAAYRRNKAVVPNIVTDDIRFSNEVRRVRELGGVILNVYRPGVVKGNHASETQELSYDYRIVNDGSFDDLSRKVAVLIGNLTGNRTDP